MRGGHSVPHITHDGDTLPVKGGGYLGRGWHLEDIIDVTDPHFLFPPQGSSAYLSSLYGAPPAGAFPHQHPVSFPSPKVPWHLLP